MEKCFLKSQHFEVCRRNKSFFIKGVGIFESTFVFAILLSIMKFKLRFYSRFFHLEKKAFCKHFVQQTKFPFDLIWIIVKKGFVPRPSVYLSLIQYLKSLRK